MDQSALPPATRAADLAPPPPSRKSLVRGRLLDRLSSARCPCTVVIAPAGFGKTTLLAQWAEQDQRESLWVPVKERHNDPVLLVGQIAVALDATEALGEEVFAPLNSPLPDVSGSVVPRLCEALGRRSTPVALILDDMHSLSGPDALTCIRVLAEQFPESSRLVMASRSEPEIGLGRLRAKGRLEDIRSDVMALTKGEATQLLAAEGHVLSDQLVAKLVELTEGWPAGLYLAALALEGKEEPDEVVERFHGDERVVADYVRDEFLSPLDEETVHFLTGASLLGRLSGEMCDAVLQRSGSDKDLRRLSRSNMLLAPLDTKDHEFHMHTLLSEMLQSELHRVDAGEEAEIHRRASDWYLDHGNVDQSTEHAIASGDIELAGERIWAAAASYVTEGRRATLRSWTESFSDEQLASVPTLSTTMALTSLSAGDGEEMRHWVTVAKGRIAQMHDPPDPSLVAACEMVRLSGNTSDGLAAVADGFAALYLLLPEDSPWRSYARFVEGVIAHLLGDRPRARRLLQEGGLLRAPPVVQTHCHGQLALVALDEGRGSDAEVAAREAVSKVHLFGLEAYAASALPLGVMGLVRARQGDAAGAAPFLVSAEELLVAGSVANDWFTAEMWTTLSRAHLALGDREGARARLEEADRLRREFPEAIVLDDWIATVREALDTGLGVDDGSQLSPAELRLLHLLPSHLSFPEIAEQLVVSPNTVKTQSRSIYRKFGVGSRTGAVDFARQAGLLGREDG